MNTLLFLNSADFRLEEEEGKTTGTLLCEKTSELLIVLFYSTNCPHCGPARATFNTVVSQFVQGCKFGMINITQNPKVTHLAKTSKTPIRYVPFILAFFRGRPLADYKSAITQPNLVQFVQQCYASIKTKVDAFGAVKKEAEVTPFTGVPVCDEGVCYLSFDHAYPK